MGHFVFDIPVCHVDCHVPWQSSSLGEGQALPHEARVGTVDKFQGQEAPVVIYSMSCSTAADAPRGMAFLYSPNRMNVATSRAKCLSIVVAAPKLLEPSCNTPEQIRLACGLCRFMELATAVRRQLELHFSDS